MLFWFVGTSVLTIFFVFRDPRFDYRPLVIGALIPDVVDGALGGVLGGAGVMHSLTGAVGLMMVVMALTVGRRVRRKMFLALPIGVLLHLVFDAAFANTQVFWWPFTGGFGGAPLPMIERSWPVNALLEMLGALMMVWCVRTFGLRDPDRRQALVRRGVLTAVEPSRP